VQSIRKRTELLSTQQFVPNAQQFVSSAIKSLQTVGDKNL